MNLGVTYIIYPIQMDKVGFQNDTCWIEPFDWLFLESFEILKKIDSQAVIYILIAFTTFAVTKDSFDRTAKSDESGPK